MRKVIAVPVAPVTVVKVGESSAQLLLARTEPEATALVKLSTLVKTEKARGPVPVLREPRLIAVAASFLPEAGVSVNSKYAEPLAAWLSTPVRAAAPALLPPELPV